MGIGVGRDRMKGIEEEERGKKKGGEVERGRKKGRGGRSEEKTYTGQFSASSSETEGGPVKRRMIRSRTSCGFAKER